jgi:hypothetical protein
MRQALNVYGEPTNHSTWTRIGATYPVLSIEVDPEGPRFRMLGKDRHTPALFRPEMFEIASPIIPPTCVVATIAPGAFHLAPEPWTQKGFWERYFDSDPEAMASFERERAKILAAAPWPHTPGAAGARTRRSA